MKKTLIVLSLLLVILLINPAFSGGIFRIILPSSDDLSGYSVAEGELFYDDANEVMKLQVDGDAKTMITHEDLRFTLNPLSTIASESLTNGQLVYDDTNKEVIIRRDGQNEELQRGIKKCYLKDQKPMRTAGGTCIVNPGVIQVRDLNVSSGDCDFVTFPINFTNNDYDNNGLTPDETQQQFTLEAGKYYFRATAPSLRTILHQALLYNVTDSATEIPGSAELSDSGTGGTSKSIIVGAITITASKTFDIRHVCSQTRNGDGFGPMSVLEYNIYTQVEITKIK